MAGIPGPPSLVVGKGTYLTSCVISLSGQTFHSIIACNQTKNKKTHHIINCYKSVEFLRVDLKANYSKNVFKNSKI